MSNNINYFDGKSVPNYEQIWKESDCILLSNDKSGSTWFRMCIELLSQRPTIGDFIKVGYDPACVSDFACIDLPLLSQIEYNQFNGFIENKCILAKTHETNVIESLAYRPQKLILLLRNYKELICRPYVSDGNTHYNKEIIEKHKPTITHRYAEKIKIYDNFEGEKVVVYYEDLINDFQSVMIKMIDFLQLGSLGYSNLSGLLRDYSNFKDLGFKSYKEMPTLQLGIINDKKVNYFNPKLQDDPRIQEQKREFLTTMVGVACRYPAIQSSEYYYNHRTKELFLQLRIQTPGRTREKTFVVKSNLEHLEFQWERLKKQDPKIIQVASLPHEYILLLPDTAIYVTYKKQYKTHTAKSGDVNHHSNNIISLSEKKQIDSFMKKNIECLELYKKYIRRYEEKET